MNAKTLLHTMIALAGAVSVFAAPPATPADTHVVVIFQNPEKFTDVRDSYVGSDQVRDGYLEALKTHLEDLAPRHLAAGQILTITFTDIDMAGDFEPWGGPRSNDVRIIKDIYPPRLKFTFKVTDAKGTVLKEGEQKLADMAFQMRSAANFGNDPLYYEKAMLNDWLDDEFGRPKKKAQSH